MNYQLPNSSSSRAQNFGHCLRRVKSLSITMSSRRRVHHLRSKSYSTGINKPQNKKVRTMLDLLLVSNPKLAGKQAKEKEKNGTTVFPGQAVKLSLPQEDAPSEDEFLVEEANSENETSHDSEISMIEYTAEGGLVIDPQGEDEFEGLSYSSLAARMIQNGVSTVLDL